ncbi:MAG TPA: PKD domain-containing protein [Cytophagales bacterium]|nr:PKD domain-containing protein [Cytophagales bacterium]
MKLLPAKVIFLILFFSLLNCREPDQLIPNSPPIAQAGEDRSAKAGELILLDANNSSDKENDLLSFQWVVVTQPTGSKADIVNPDSVKARIIPDLEGVYMVRLLVSDQIDISRDSIVITILKGNGAPVANAGSDQSVEVGAEVVLDGSNSSDPDGDNLTFLWSFISKPAQSGAGFIKADSIKTDFTPDLPGGYQIQLSVSDGTNTSLDTVVVTANLDNQPPVADAGIDQSVDIGANIVLNGNGSSDPDEDPITYHWTFESKPPGSSATLSDTHKSDPNFTLDKIGKYVLILEVSDGNLTSTDKVEITTKPITIAGINPTSGQTGTQVMISGTNFSSVTDENTVRFNGVLATIISATHTSLTVSVPNAAGTGTVSVTTNGITATGPVFTYIQTSTVSTFVQLNQAVRIAVGPDGTLYVSDYANNVIKQVTPQGVITTYAGTGQQGYNDGKTTEAMFNHPAGIAVDAVGNVYVADNGNHCIRKINTSGVVSTLAGFPQAGFADSGPNSPTGQFNYPVGLAIDESGILYVADQNNNAIRKVTQAGVVTTLAGNGTADFVNGTGTAARFNLPTDVAVDGNGNVYVADRNNHRIRKITQTGVVTTLAGSGAVGLQNGAGAAATFNNPYGLSCDDSGNVYVSELSNHTIRKITPQGAVTTIAGNGSAGSANGTGTNATFNQPTGLVVSSNTTIYIADFGNQLIRLITIE